VAQLHVAFGVVRIALYPAPEFLLGVRRRALLGRCLAELNI
jgi:hypothetical protein